MIEWNMYIEIADSLESQIKFYVLTLFLMNLTGISKINQKWIVQKDSVNKADAILKMNAS